MENNLKNLKKILHGMGGVLVAYSGGVDSTFLLMVAKETLQNKILAITIASPLYPRREIEEATKIARDYGIKHRIIRIEELGDEDFLSNSPERCYFCKQKLFSGLIKIAERDEIPWVIDGTNLDDDQDFRPGTRAARELGIRSPLNEAKLTKNAIRELSGKMGLPGSNRPSLACLASRIPYGERITLEKLSAIEAAETYLNSMGFKQVRVRSGYNTARIEVSPEEIGLLLDESLRIKIVKHLHEIGYLYVTLDLQGYRTGSMNEVLKK